METSRRPMFREEHADLCLRMYPCVEQLVLQMHFHFPFSDLFLHDIRGFHVSSDSVRPSQTGSSSRALESPINHNFGDCYDVFSRFLFMFPYHSNIRHLITIQICPKILPPTSPHFCNVPVGSRLLSIAPSWSLLFTLSFHMLLTWP